MKRVNGHNFLAMDEENEKEMKLVANYLTEKKEATAAQICHDCNITWGQLSSLLITMTYRYPNLYEGESDRKKTGATVVYGMAAWF